MSDFMEHITLGAHLGLAGSQPEVVLFGTQWCAATQMVRRWLARQGIPFRYVDLETSPESAGRLRWLTGGTASHPTVLVNGEVLVEPSLSELAWALRGSP